jgi:hypothetical protein
MASSTSSALRVLDLEPGLTVQGRVARLVRGVFIVFVVCLACCWMVESQRRWDKGVQEEQVLPILQLSLQNPYLVLPPFLYISIPRVQIFFQI